VLYKGIRRLGNLHNKSCEYSPSTTESATAFQQLFFHKIE
jgi:hypothetical protein